MRKEASLALVERELVRRGAASSTIRRTVRAARSFLEWAKKPLARIRRDDVRRFLAERSQSVKPAHQLWLLMRLRCFFSVLVAREILSMDPTSGLFVEVPESEPRLFLTEKEVGKLLARSLELPKRHVQPWSRAIALRNRATLELLYGVGLRAAEATSVRVTDLDLLGGAVLARRVKRGKCGALPLPKAALVHLERYLREGRPALVNGKDEGRLLVSHTGRPLGTEAIRALVAGIARRAGIEAHPHAFRRAVATHLVRAQVPVRAVQELLGHRSLSSTAQYMSVDREDLRRTVAILERS